jgi:hypothetical protein
MMDIFVAASLQLNCGQIRTSKVLFTFWQRLRKKIPHGNLILKVAIEVKSHMPHASVHVTCTMGTAIKFQSDNCCH